MATLPHWYGKCDDMRLPVVEETSNPITATMDIFRGSWMTFNCYSKIGAFSTWFSDMARDVPFFWSFDWFDVYVTLGLALTWTLLRYFCVKAFFEPFARWVGMLEQNIVKFSEAIWKCLAYAFMWTAAVYVTFYRGYDFFQNPMRLWAGLSHTSAPFDLCVLYALEASFYVHSVYATLYMDVWRKDFTVMMTHHFVTLTLLSTSYAVGFLKVGVLIFVLNDVSDILLEFSKALGYLRHLKSGFYPKIDLLATAISVVFVVQWIYLRLQLHMTKVWRSGAIGVWWSHPRLPVPFHFFFIAFLGALFFFYAYWTYFIFKFIIRMLSPKKAGTLDDPRDDPVERSSKKSKSGQCRGESSGEPPRKEE